MAVAIGNVELRPARRDARRDLQHVSVTSEAEHMLDRDAIHPRSRAGVPGPTAAPEMFGRRVNVRREHVGLDLVALYFARVRRMVNRVQQRKQPMSALTFTELAKGLHRPQHAMRVLS